MSCEGAHDFDPRHRGDDRLARAVDVYASAKYVVSLALDRGEQLEIDRAHNPSGDQPTLVRPGQRGSGLLIKAPRARYLKREQLPDILRHRTGAQIIFRAGEPPHVFGGNVEA